MVQVRTPCRLHFGMFSFGSTDKAQFGGVGMMVGPPYVDVRIEPAGRFTINGSTAQRQRTMWIVERLAWEWKLGDLPACKITVASPRDHTGLGVGTQLSLAVAAGLRRFLGLMEVPAEELARATKRGARSAVGTYGFARGGLIVDAGKESTEPLGKLAWHVALPEAWRFVLICPTSKVGLAGEGEALAFERLPPVPEETNRTLWTITTEQMLPAVNRRDCDAFGDAVFQFGRTAGECFATVQGGPFASPEIAELAASMRDHGVRGVGQSSWGPTVFAVTHHDDEALRLVEWARTRYGETKYDITIAQPNNHGATITAN
jgi:beta-RFAP synthase